MKYEEPTQNNAPAIYWEPPNPNWNPWTNQEAISDEYGVSLIFEMTVYYDPFNSK